MIDIAGIWMNEWWRWPWRENVTNELKTVNGVSLLLIGLLRLEAWDLQFNAYISQLIVMQIVYKSL